MEIEMKQKMSYKNVVKNNYLLCGIFSILAGISGIVCSLFKSSFLIDTCSILASLCMIISIIFEMRPFSRQCEQSDEMSENNINIASRKTIKKSCILLLFISVITLALEVLHVELSIATFRFISFFCYFIYGIINSLTGYYFIKLEDK